MKRLLSGVIIGLIATLTFLALFYFLAILRHPVSSVVVSINSKQSYQTIEGFGASIAYYESFLVNHPQKEEIYKYIFDDLRVSILRLRNCYEYEDDFKPKTEEIAEKMLQYSSLNPQIMMSVWSPPVELKSNNEKVGGTLKKDEDGRFMYDAFAQYWLDSLDAYQKLGIEPDYITIENEPSWDSHESCMFRETEIFNIAGYDKALEAVHKKLDDFKNHPKIFGPEVHGIGYNSFQNYAAKFNHDLLDGYAYHLYHGGDENNSNPDLFIPNLKRIADNYTGKPIFQTEYHRGDWFNTAWIMHNCIVHGNVSAYLYWDLIWAKDRGSALIEIESPNRLHDWTTDEGYILTDKYYAFRQFSRFILPEYKRISAKTESENLRVSSYINPEKNLITVVILNISRETGEEITLNYKGFKISGGSIIRTSETDKGKYISKYVLNKSLNLPARSITTIILDVKAGI